MTISKLKQIINEQISPFKVKSLMGSDKKPLSSAKDAYQDVPSTGYYGMGTLTGGEEFAWSFHYDGKNWLFNSQMSE